MVMLPYILILNGPPCSGKSTFAKKMISKHWNTVRINRDDCRFMLKNQFFIGHRLETIVKNNIPKLIDELTDQGYNVIMDNTHCKIGDIDNIIKNYSDIVDVKIITFEESLFTLFYRNLKRKLFKGIWIPFEAIKTINSNQKKVLKQIQEKNYVTYTAKEAKKLYNL